MRQDSREIAQIWKGPDIGVVWWCFEVRCG